MRVWRPLALVACVVAATLVVSAQARQCPKCVWGRYWPTAPGKDCRKGEHWPCFPETDFLPDDASLGVAFSGGGTRSATMALGQLRGLRRIGLLDKVRYVSAISGGAWAAVPYVYTSYSLDDFLGAYEDYATMHQTDEETKALIDRVLNTPHGRLGEAIVASSLTPGSIQEVFGDLGTAFSSKSGDQLWLTLDSTISGATRREPDRLNKTYSRLIGRVFIDPLVDVTDPGKPISAWKKPGELIGSTSSGRLFTWTSRTLQDAQDVSGGALPSNMLMTGLDKPFLIASGTVIVARHDYPYPLLMPIEYTPMYVGVRHRFSPRYGGVYVPPWAYDTTSVAQVDTAGRRVLVDLDDKRRFTLGDVVGSSGAAPQLALVLSQFAPEAFRERVQRASEVFPAFRHFTLPDSGAAPLRTPVTEEIGHGDGGLLDNLGIMPLLARGVKNILVFNNSVTDHVEFNDDFQSLFFSAGPPGGSGNRGFNRVFWCNDQKKDGCTRDDGDTYYTMLIKGMIERRSQGKSQVFCAGPWKVLDNETFDVKAMDGEHDGVNVCWFYTSSAKDWESGLPDVLKTMVEQPAGKKTAASKPSASTDREAAKHIDKFPYLATFGQNKTHVIQLTAPQVNLLSNLTGWIVTHEEACVRATLVAHSVTTFCDPDHLK